MHQQEYQLNKKSHRFKNKIKRDTQNKKYPDIVTQKEEALKQEHSDMYSLDSDSPNQSRVKECEVQKATVSRQHLDW